MSPVIAVVATTTIIPVSATVVSTIAAAAADSGKRKGEGNSEKRDEKMRLNKKNIYILNSHGVH